MQADATQKSRLLLLAGFAFVALACGGVLLTDTLVSRGFGKALDGPRTNLTLEAIPVQDAATAGDEGYWLTRAEVESPTPLAKPLAVGDNITIAGRDGRERKLEVMHLKAIGEPIAKVGTGALPVRLLLVTCRVVGAAEGDASTPVRFIIEGEAVEPAAPAPSKAL